VIEPQDLQGDARRMFDAWISIGLTEQAALESLARDGFIHESDDDRLVRNFQELGLSLTEARIAAAGRDGPRLRPVQAASIAEGSPQARALVETVRELADSALRRGCVRPRGRETRELAAVREAA
jgi:hypothetical protein